ncbi:hypothetical protein [Legionella jamestowniensis]|uniref:Dot/Icm T4SS effector n=1 Tax=Legionella jamestowniensis TaxID=455 RepID=A0A0W0UTY2_9GAMM|nr:hypothetical protein [Legionella jamestowniensis]KTD11326.1 hypothetical protein Ljam_0520 [Legionella jamestowniensis]OCH98813.1 hypothetical protein A8135_10960 [Legionella jamestowniensis]SFL69045.1 hypothetical protein SAMN02746073_1393 [Legionella jamestowniensis DSM 19215]
MAFTIPLLDVLILQSQNLDTAYKEERLAMDKKRFFSSLRGSTSNPMRLDDIKFITTFGGNISNNQFNYQILRKALKSENPTVQEYGMFLRNALSGAFLLHLSKINDGYLFEESVKDRSAMAKLTCNLFSVEKFSDVPKKELRICLEALQTYLSTVTNSSGLRLKWHPSKTNRALLRDIAEEMNLLGLTKATRSELSV